MGPTRIMFPWVVGVGETPQNVLTNHFRIYLQFSLQLWVCICINTDAAINPAKQTPTFSSFSAYCPYFGKKMKGSLCNHLAVCLCIPPLIFSFSMWFVLYQRKLGD
jgi:hypothetical protein